MRNQDPQLTVLESNRENLDPVIELRFPTESIRWITAQAFPLRDWEVAEFEVYGEGFVEETVLVSQILDFGQPINWGKIRWDADVPEGTRIEVRTRTGNSPDPSLYFDENINGDIRPITLKPNTKNSTRPAACPPCTTRTTGASGRRPTTLPRACATAICRLRRGAMAHRFCRPGRAATSSFPFACYLPLPLHPAFAHSRSNSATHRLPREILGEVWPIAVDSFAPTEFTYIVRPEFSVDDTGFDRLEIRTHAQVQAVSAVKRDGTELDLNDFVPDIQADRFVVSFPRLQGEADSFKQLEVRFVVPVLRFGTEFSGWVFDSNDSDQIKQQVRPGNATFRFSGDALAVNTPVGGRLLVDIAVASNPLTPNGDGVNETLEIAYKLREVTASRPVRLVLYNLAGQLVVELPPITARSGEFAHRWDGRDAAQQLVPPGTYIWRLQLEEKEERSGILSVAY